MFTLKKKKKKAAAPSPARLSEDGSDDDEPAEPPPPRSAFPQWLKAREDKGEAPPLDPDQRRACDCIVVQSKNTFVTGSGGNGKSHVTRTILDFFEKHYGDQYSQKVAVCAPTGIAATHVNGTTIHSATGIGVPKCQEDFRALPSPSRSLASPARRRRVVDSVPRRPHAPGLPQGALDEARRGADY